jgi:hypothetical protein
MGKYYAGTQLIERDYVGEKNNAPFFCSAIFDPEK